jgi:hypothetical protein
MYFFLVRLVLSVSLSAAAALETLDLLVPSYDDLPPDAVFPGPWNDNIQAPANKSYIQPAGIWNSEGDVSYVVVPAGGNWDGGSLTMSPGGLVTLEFPQNIGGRCVEHTIDL